MKGLVYFLFFIGLTKWIRSESCTPGFFGENCSLHCHCLENDCKSTTDSPGCLSGSCSPGYIGLPACQTACGLGFFGLSCSQNCSCFPKNNCSHINGNCIPPNRCTSERFGPGCQSVRAKLMKPPLLEAICTKISISWSAFNSSIDVGITDVREYRVELHSSASHNLIELKNVTKDQAKDGAFQEIFSGVTPAETYWARVVPIFFVDTGGGDGYLEEGVPSPPSDDVYVAKEDCSSTLAPFVFATADSIPSLSSTDIQTTTATTTIISTFKTTLSPSGERLTGPRDCSLVGLSTDWAAFRWHHGSISCGLGELIGYELSLASLGQDAQLSGNEELPADEIFVKRYRTDSFTTSIVAQDLRPGFKYRAQIFALHEQGSIACSDIKMGGIEITAKSPDSLGNLDFTTFSEREAQSTPRVLISSLGRHYDRFSVRVELSQPEVAERPHLWILAFPVESRLPIAVDLGSRGVSVQTAFEVKHHFSFVSNIHPATRYRLYGWAAPTSERKFIGTTAEIWTSPKPFAFFPNFVLPFPQLIEVLDNTLVVRFPNISGYYGGPITDYFMAISPRSVAFPSTSGSLGVFSLLQHRLSLPSSAWVVFHSRSFPHNAVTIGDGVVEVEIDLSGSPEAHIFTDPSLEPDSNYTLFIAVVSSLGRDAIFRSGTEESFAVSPTRTRFVSTATLRPWRSSSMYTQSLGIGFAVVICIVCLIALAVFIWWRFLRLRSAIWKKSKQYSLNMRPSRRTSGGSTLTTIEDFMTALPKSYLAWSLPINLHDPRFLVIDPQRGPDNNLLGTKSIHEIAETYFREYKSLPVNKSLPQVQAKRVVNRGKNRCLYSMPYDHNRVQLRRRGDFQTDYINASYVSGYLRRKAYICAQSPFNAVTASDFWAMVEQCGVAQIVILDNLIEGGIVKCSKYWPDKNRSCKAGIDKGYCDSLSGNERRQYDTIVIEAGEVQNFANFTVRRFRVTSMADDDHNAVHWVTQFHYHRWRCHSSDSDDDDMSERDENDLVNSFDILAFLDFYFHVKMSTKMEDGPILVHCEDGVSRSSIFIAFDVLLQQLMHEHTVTVGRTCASLRRTRQCAVPTARHFALLYDLLFEAGIAGHSILDLDIRSTLASLNQRNMTAGYTYLKEQWYLLQNYLSITTSPPIAFPSIVIEGGSSVSTELFAVWVDGLTIRKDILLARAPRTTLALVAFWQIVFKRKISCIVNMEPTCFEPEGEAVRFWPPSSNNLNGRTYEEETLFGIQGVTSPFTYAPDIGIVVDCEGEAITTRNAGPWYQLGDLQVAQVGCLVALPPPIPLSPRRGYYREGESKKMAGCLFKQKIILRKLLPIPPQQCHHSHNQYPRRVEFHNLEILHFKARWRFRNQVPPRGAMLQALEVFREARGVGPAAVLCADGTTHSGLFVAAFSLAERLTRDRFLDLFHTLKALKLKRSGVVCSVRQLHFLYRLMVSWVDEVMVTKRSQKPPAYLEDSRSSHQDLSTSAIFSGSNLSTDKRRSFGAGEYKSKNTSNNSLVAATTEDEDDENDELRINSPKPVNVLYRYYNDELSRLLIVKSMSVNQKSV